MSSLAAGQRRILVHGHRGARARRPENTVAAFQYAIEQGVDALEMDMAVTADDVVVISHDPVLRSPICIGPMQSAVIRRLNLADLRQWDCGAVKNPAFPNQVSIPGARIPTLDDVFELAPRGSFNYNLEAKISPETPQYTPPPDEFARLVLAKIREYKLEKRVTLLSFDFRILLEMRRLAPEIPLTALTSTDMREYSLIAKDAGRAEIVSPQLQLVTPEKVEAAHKAGLRVAAWTANTEAEWDRLIAAKVDSIVTDDPAALIAYLKQK